MNEQYPDGVGVDPAKPAEHDLSGDVDNPAVQRDPSQFLDANGEPTGDEILEPAGENDRPPSYRKLIEEQKRRGAEKFLHELNNPIDTGLATIQDLLDNHEIKADEKIEALKKIFTDLQNSIREELQRLKASQDRTL